MRAYLISLAAVALMLLAPSAHAQSVDPLCHSDTIAPVVVTMSDGRTIRGTLLCVSTEEVVLTQNGATVTARLSSVRKIQTRPDPVWDGALKGAAIPAILWAVFCRDNPGAMLQAAAAYGAIGLTLDGLQKNARTIYARERSASLTWRIRF